MSHWETVLENQVRLMNWWRSPRGETYAAGFARDVAQKDRPGVEFYRAIAPVESAKLERAEPVYVDANVCELVTLAANSVGLEPLQPEDLFTLEGFALLERPVELEDVQGKVAAFRAFSWGPMLAEDPDGRPEGYLNVTLYSHWEDDDDYSPSLRAELMRRQDIASKADVGVAWRRVFGGNDLSMYHSALFPWSRVPDELVTTAGVKSTAIDAKDLAPSTLWAFLQSFFRLAEQRVIAPVRTHGNRASRKRLQRLREDVDGVLVVTLRRPKAPPAEEAEGSVEWSCQWLVSGHWRAQWYPSLGEHRQIWIAAYVKGPEDRPLRVHAGRAFEFTR